MIKQFELWLDAINLMNDKKRQGITITYRTIVALFLMAIFAWQVEIKKSIMLFGELPTMIEATKRNSELIKENSDLIRANSDAIKLNTEILKNHQDAIEKINEVLKRNKLGAIDDGQREHATLVFLP